MLVAHSHRFIFIKTRKTAGSSVEAALRGFLGPEDVITPMAAADRPGSEPADGPPVGNYEHTGLRACLQAVLGKPGKRLFGLQRARFLAHTSAADARRKLGAELWESYLKVATARNPFDMLVSLYFNERRNGRVPDSMSFDSFVRSRLVLPRNVDLCTIDGRLAVDVLLRYEHLQDDLAALGQRLGLGRAPADRLARMHLNAGQRASREIAAHYDADLQRYVARRFAEEFAAFGYDPEVLPDASGPSATAQNV
jgi:hypothetical protein